jgi:hypothetical protein
LPGELEFSVQTLKRWVAAFASMAKELHEIAQKTLAELKPNWKFEKDKRLFRTNFPSAHSETKNQNLNLLYQIFILREYFPSLVEPKDFLVWLIFVARLNPTPTRFVDDANKRIRNNKPQPP